MDLPQKSIGSLKNFWPYGSSIPALQPYNISWAGGANTLKWSILALNFICISFFALQSWEWQQHSPKGSLAHPQTPPKRRKGYGTHWAVSGTCLWILTHQSDSHHVACMWLSCDTVLSPTIGAHESHWCVAMQNDCRMWPVTIIMTTHHFVHPKKRSMHVYKTFPSFGCGVWGWD